MRPDRADRPRTARPRPRGTDRLEDVVAWVLMSASLVLLVGSCMVGLSVHAQLSERARTERAQSTELSAVLLENSPIGAVPPDGAGPTVGATAQWTGTDGLPRTGRIEVRQGTPAGSRVEVWVQRDGTVSAPPTAATDAGIAGVLIGFHVLLLGGAVLVGAWMGVRRLTASVNAAAWEREWAQVGPEWTGRR